MCRSLQEGEVLSTHFQLPLRFQQCRNHKFEFILIFLHKLLNPLTSLVEVAHIHVVLTTLGVVGGRCSNPLLWLGRGCPLASITGAQVASAKLLLCAALPTAGGL